MASIVMKDNGIIKFNRFMFLKNKLKIKQTKLEAIILSSKSLPFLNIIMNIKNKAYMKAPMKTWLVTVLEYTTKSVIVSASWNPVILYNVIVTYNPLKKNIEMMLNNTDIVMIETKPMLNHCGMPKLV